MIGFEVRPVFGPRAEPAELNTPVSIFWVVLSQVSFTGAFEELQQIFIWENLAAHIWDMISSFFLFHVAVSGIFSPSYFWVPGFEVASILKDAPVSSLHSSAFLKKYACSEQLKV